MTVWMMALAAAAPVPASVMPPAVPVMLAQLIIRRSTIVRIQTQPPAAVPAPTRWRERKGPKCVAMDRVGAAAVVAEDSVDLMLRGGSRVRARFEDDCPDLDYYSGFYIARGADGQICAGRDLIHVRSGGECRIVRFRALDAVVAKPRGNGVLDRIRRRLGH